MVIIPGYFFLFLYENILFYCGNSIVLKCLCEVILSIHVFMYKVSLLSTHNIRFYEELEKLSQNYHQILVGLGGSVGCASEWWSAGCGFDPHRVSNILSSRFDHEIFSSHSHPFSDSRRAFVSFWQKNVHNTCSQLRGLSLPSKSVVK